MTRAKWVLVAAVGLLSAAYLVSACGVPLAAGAGGHTLFVNGVGYDNTHEAGTTFHWEAPNVPIGTSVTFPERSQTWTGQGYQDCEGGLAHWISNENNLVQSGCVEGPTTTPSPPPPPPTTTSTTTTTLPNNTTTTSTTTTTTTTCPDCGINTVVIIPSSTTTTTLPPGVPNTFAVPGGTTTTSPPTGTITSTTPSNTSTTVVPGPTINTPATVPTTVPPPGAVVTTVPPTWGNAPAHAVTFGITRMG